MLIRPWYYSKFSFRQDLLIKKKKKVCLERQRVRAGEGRERERENIPGRLHAISTEPDGTHEPEPKSRVRLLTPLSHPDTPSWNILNPLR